MRKVIISPYAKALRNGERNPKNYPWWNELIALLKKEDCHIIQIGLPNEPAINADERLNNVEYKELQKLAISADLILSVDSFFPHLCDYIGKKCYVLFSKSDPNIFGHASNVNILKDRKYLKEKQFDIWEVTEYDENAFVRPEEVMNIIKQSSICCV